MAILQIDSSVLEASEGCEELVVASCCFIIEPKYSALSSHFIWASAVVVIRALHRSCQCYSVERITWYSKFMAAQAASEWVPGTCLTAHQHIRGHFCQSREIKILIWTELSRMNSWLSSRTPRSVAHESSSITDVPVVSWSWVTVSLMNCS